MVFVGAQVDTDVASAGGADTLSGGADTQATDAGLAFGSAAVVAGTAVIHVVL